MADNAGPGDRFRRFDEITEPDPRQPRFVVVDDETGAWRTKTLEDIHKALDELELHAAVPLDLRVQFDNARNLLLYSWFAYRFVQVAEFQALRTLEFALREAFGIPIGKSRVPTLAPLLKRAIHEGRISGEELAAAARSRRNEPCRAGVSDVARRLKDPGALAYLDELSKGLGRWRNWLAHGGSLLAPGGFHILVVCQNLINQLFRPRCAAAEAGSS